MSKTLFLSPPSFDGFQQSALEYPGLNKNKFFKSMAQRRDDWAAARGAA